jgi:hypothetical protein
MAEASTLAEACCFTRHVSMVTGRTSPGLPVSKRLWVFVMLQLEYS